MEVERTFKTANARGEHIMRKLLIIPLFWGLVLTSAATADECTQGDCVNGEGTFVFSTGHTYTGAFKNGKRNGDGVLLMPGNRKIVGVWENNELVRGTYSKPDGTTYEGQWRFRERNGQGTLTFPDGRKYTGAFKSDRRHGQGTMTYPDGRKYVGTFKFGERSGQGTMVYPDGRRQEGTFKYGEFVGN